MAKTANVMARIDPELKEQAEDILSRLGVPVSTFITMAYNQIVLKNGIPFDLTLPACPPSLEDLTKEDFDAMMERGLSESKAGLGDPVDQAFSEVRQALRL